MDEAQRGKAKDQMQANVIALGRGYRYRLELGTANGGRGGHEFATTLADAKARMRQLRSAGYAVTIFRITNLGKLDFI